MKKSTLFVMSMALLCASLTTNAQIFTTKVGYNLAESKLHGIANPDDLSVKLGIHFGETVEFQITNVFSIEPGVLFSSKGCNNNELASDSTAKYSYTTSLNYLDIPINFKFSQPIVKDLRLFAVVGPYMGIGLFGKTKGQLLINGVVHKIDGKISWNGTPFQRLDYGATLGLGVEFNILQLSISYDLGLNNTFGSPDFWNQNRVLKLSLGYRFFGKKLI